MAARKYKAKKQSIKKEASVDEDRQSTWSELPPTNSSIHSSDFENKLWRLKHSRAPGITKSWLQTTTRCGGAAYRQPQLRHVTAGPSKNPSPHPHYKHFLHDSTNIAESLYEMPFISYWYCSLKSDTNPKFYQPPTTPSHRLDLLGPKLYVEYVDLGPNSPNSGLMVNYRAYSPTSYWNRYASIRYECTTADPFCDKKRMMEFANIVQHCDIDRFYATSLQGAVVAMQVRNTRLVITAVGADRAVPSSNSRFFKEYLVKIEGEILLVFLIHKKSLAVVDNVEVYRLDLDNLGLIKVKRLQGKTMFLKKKCVWVKSAEFGCRDDLVYFTQGSDNEWRVYDMKTCCISHVLDNEWMQTMI